TRPLLYRKIDGLRTVRKRYVETRARRGDLTLDEAEQALEDFHTRMQAALDETRQSAPEEGIVAAPHPPSRGVLPHVETGVGRSELERIYAALDTVPDGLPVHPKLARPFETRPRVVHQI